MFNYINLIVEYIINDDNHKIGKKIIINNNIELIRIQLILCKLLENCYIYTYMNTDRNTAFQLYKNKLFGIIKQNHNMIYIWKIK